MDEKRPVEAADEIQDALASMLAVEPSPEFAARVRQRIAAGASVREWRPVHLVLPAFAAVVVLGILLISTETRRIAPEQPVPGTATRVSEPEPASSAPVTAPAAVVAVQQEQRPTVLVPRNEIVTMRRFLSAAQAGRFEFELLPPGVPVADELSPPDPISVPPIDMMPIGTSSSFE